MYYRICELSSTDWMQSCDWRELWKFKTDLVNEYYDNFIATYKGGKSVRKTAKKLQMNTKKKDD